MLYQVVEAAYESQVEFAKGKFLALKAALEAREKEILEDIDGVFQPLTSKLLSFTSELDQSLKSNTEQLSTLEEMVKLSDQDRVLRFHPVEVMTPTCKITEKLTSRIHKLPTLSINIERVADFIRVMGKVEVSLEKKLSFASI